jgi:hypothetical protein
MAVDSCGWRRWTTATAVVAAAVLTPLLSGAPAAAAASLCGPPADTVPPQVSSVRFSTQSVNLATRHRTVTVTAQATDTAGSGIGSGVTRIVLNLFGAGSGAFVSLSRTSGTPDDGGWQGSFTIAKTARRGTLVLSNVDVSDAAGNTQSYSQFGSHPRSPTDIGLQAGWDTTLTVKGAKAPTPPPPAPTKPGKLTGFGLTPQLVDTTSHPKAVRVTASFAGPHPVGVSVFLASTSGRRFFGTAEMKPTSGGRWVGTITVKQWVGDATAHPQLLVNYGPGVTPHDKNYGPAQLRALRFPASLAITSGVDPTKPVLHTLSFAPSSVDTTSGGQTVIVTATATDALSGVDTVNAGFFINGRGNAQPSLFRSVNLVRAGNEWTGQITFQRCVPSGSWRVNVVVIDGAGNDINDTSAKLIAAGLPGALTVTSDPGDVIAPSVANATASAAVHTITLDFSEGVKNVTPSTLSVFALKPAATRYEHPLPISSVACSNGTGPIDCDGSGGLATSAQLTVPGVSAGQQYRLWANQDAVISQLTDAAGNPLSWSFSVATVTGS